MHESVPTAHDVDAPRGPLTGCCYRMLGSAADTDDAVQETVIRAYPHLDRFDPSRARVRSRRDRQSAQELAARSVTFLGTGGRFAEFGLPDVLPPQTTDEFGRART